MRRLFAVWLLMLAGAAAAQTSVALVTYGPGDEYWARFGHNGILIESPEQPAVVYNFGYFDFDQPNFLGRFLRGRMLYALARIAADRDLGYYARVGRSVDLQWLRLSEERASSLAARLAENAREERAEYRYDYFTTNCSTRVRDALDFALNGALQRQTAGRSRGLTYRSESLRLAASLPWMAVGIDLGLGIDADRPLSRWEEGFVPARLQEALREVRDEQGQPVIAREERLAEQRLAGSAPLPPRWGGVFAALGLGFAALLTLTLRQSGPLLRRLGVVALGSWWLFSGVIGVFLLALWLGTDHTIAWGNRNIWLFNPLALLLLPATLALWRGEAPAPWARAVARLLAFSAGVAVFLLLVPVRAQDSLNWIFLGLPIHCAVALCLPVRHRKLP